MRQSRKILLLVLFCVSLTGCGLFAIMMIAQSATCKLKMDKSCIQSSCGLINGVFFEKLEVLKMDSIGLPCDYIVSQRFECYNPGGEGLQKYRPKKIYFNRENGHYRWGTDTVNIQFRRSGSVIEMIENNTVLNEPYAYFTWGSRGYTTCPVEFEKDCWYFIYTGDQAISAIYLYIDDKMRFKVYVIDSGVCPI